MIDVKLFDVQIEEDLIEAVVEFNRLFKADPQKTLDKSYTDLWKTSNHIELDVWRKFYLDPRAIAFYNAEFELTLRAKKNVLLRKVGENNSTATVQGLMNLLKRDEDVEFDVDENKIFVYSIIPLNQHEAHAEHVRILDNIPKEIDDALTIINGDNQTE